MLSIDPLTAYIGKLNAASGNEVRSALAPLLDMLKRFHIGGLGVMHFNKKIDVENALARIADSVAFGAVARHCFVVTDDPENERRLLVKAKNNLAPDVKGLSYTIQEVHVGHDHRDGREIRQPRIVWGHEHVEISAVAGDAGREWWGRRPQSAQGGQGFHHANDGERRHSAPPKSKTPRRAKGFRCGHLKNAKRDLKIVSKKDGLAGGWRWYLPDDAPKDQPKAEEFLGRRHLESRRRAEECSVGCRCTLAPLPPSIKPSVREFIHYSKRVPCSKSTSVHAHPTVHSSRRAQ